MDEGKECLWKDSIAKQHQPLQDTQKKEREEDGGNMERERE
jgi:hypothetical protein